jgi:hypothetical protein
MNDLYTVVFLVVNTGDRLVIDGVEADVEMKTQFDPIATPLKHSKKVTKPTTRLDIMLEVATPTPKQYDTMKEMLINKKLYLHFQDIHPNLISGYIRSIVINDFDKKTTIKFDGNTIDKTYIDYLAEIVTQVNNKIFHVVTPEADPGFKKKVKFRKRKEIQALKRKLTF